MRPHDCPTSKKVVMLATQTMKQRSIFGYAYNAATLDTTNGYAANAAGE